MASKPYNPANHPLKKRFPRDAAFLRKLKEIWLAGAAAAGRGGIVYLLEKKRSYHRASGASYESRYSAPKIKKLLETLDLALRRDAEAAASYAAKPVTRWYEKTAPIGIHRVGPQWRAASPLLQLQFAHYALKGSDGPSNGFTLNIGADVASAMLEGEQSAKRYLSQRLNRWLEKELGRAVEYWFAFDLSDAQRAFHHVHGELRCLPEEHEKVLAALRQAGGEWGGNKTHRLAYQAHLCPQATDEGWITYAHKAQRDRTKAGWDHDNFRLVKGEREPAWIEDGIFISKRLKQEARALYEAVQPYVRLDGREAEKKPPGKPLKAPLAAVPESMPPTATSPLATPPLTLL